ncbi:MAG: LPS export ABC transporter periplasmic protein LptC [Ignavibacteriaceae bacterium]|nr:LPS export ABC transporter periplasmic protein LptC [Ignavibacteriaceae bacterium]MCW8818309.1 LPS export ABC transporter periplasmic protein LptC [Ignavibacteriaceae bacterium]MCW8823340.1 LPS export ABC transporter periplasmic protein LptC [Ignavibacteriaceae bacterium]MCW8960627.1 LPS export ABC transporter periplasmic protein LptC [Ignavibacteriaceae bacterium]MCW9095031.1 LPS export ABC transporter periplasmic protein LptC [Ignavibacteriaceae bacterium]
MKIFLLLLVFLIFIGCENKDVKPPVDLAFTGGELPAQESWNSTVFFTDSGKTKAILYTGHLQVFNIRKETLLDEGLKVEFFNYLGNKTTTLTSKRGRVDEKTNDLYAIDSVVAVNDSGIVVRTDELEWRNRDKKIVSNKFVTIDSPSEHIEGYGFESDQHLRNYVIYNITYITNAKKD